jgi:hypothetical protein
MLRPPAVIVHGLADARAALAPGLPVTLLSASGAALFAGCLWWREVVARARAEFPRVAVHDILDCGDGSGQAMAALRVGVVHLVLWEEAPGWGAVAAIAASQGGEVLVTPPPALDLADSRARRRLQEWLGRDTGNGAG